MTISRVGSYSAWGLTVLAGVDQFVGFYNKTVTPLRFIPTLAIGLTVFSYLFVLSRKKRPDGRKRFEHSVPLFRIGMAASVFLLVLPSVFRLYEDLIYTEWIEPSYVNKDLLAYLEKAALSKRSGQMSSTLIRLEEADQNVIQGRREDALKMSDAVDKEILAKNERLEAFRDIIRAKAESDLGNQEVAITWLDQALRIAPAQPSNVWQYLKARATSEKGLVLSRITDSTGNVSPVVLLDAAIKQYSDLQATGSALEVMRIKTDVLKRAAYANQSREQWAVVEQSAERDIEFAKGMKSEIYIEALRAYFAVLGQHYSQLIDQKTGIPKSRESQETLAKIDAIQQKLDQEIQTRVTTPELRRKVLLLEAIFNMFTRVPPADRDLGNMRASLAQLEPDQKSSDYVTRATWLQMAGLLDLKAGEKQKGIERLVQSVHIWHQQKELLKEKEVIRDMRDSLKSDPAYRMLYLDLQFRWAGLLMLRTPLRADNELNLESFCDVLNEFREAQLLNRTGIPAPVYRDCVAKGWLEN